jgi:co-chaperonin GroES (HSP10)
MPKKKQGQSLAAKPPRTGRTAARPANGKAKDDGKRVPFGVKAGDVILLCNDAGLEIQLYGEEYLIMRADGSGLLFLWRIDNVSARTE